MLLNLKKKNFIFHENCFNKDISKTRMTELL